MIRIINEDGVFIIGPLGVVYQSSCKSLCFRTFAAIGWDDELGVSVMFGNYGLSGRIGFFNPRTFKSNKDGGYVD